MKIIGRHKWLVGATITESVDEAKPKRVTSYHRFTATIRGWQGFKIYEGYLSGNTAELVLKAVKKIRDRIDSGDESVFLIKDYFLEEEKK